MTDWWRPLEAGAPDIVAAWEGIEAGERDEVRREVGARTVLGSTAGIVSQLATLAAATAELVAGFEEADLRRPGGEEDWNVAQAVGHACDARAGMAIAASRAALREVWEETGFREDRKSVV